jgi:type II secretory pathway pseudopilin PulG
MRRRSGFTIVELLVAMALIMFIMAILSEAFVAALKSFRDLKATADLAERLRSVSTLMRRELAADHFDGKRRLSAADFWTGGPPREGFFRVYQGSGPVLEGSDPNELAVGAPRTLLMNSYRATDHMLHFTVKYRGNERGDFFSAAVPGGDPLMNSPLLKGGLHYQDAREDGGTKGQYNSQWAEVVYFLRATGDTAKGTPLYALYRRQLLLVPDNGLLRNTVPLPAGRPAAMSPTDWARANYPELSCVADANNVYFNNPRDVTMPVRRFGLTGLGGTLASTYVDPNTNAATPTYATVSDSTANTATQAAYQGADLLMSDVLSFEVRLLLSDANQPANVPANVNRFESLFDITGAAGGYRSVPAATIPPPFGVGNPSFSTAGPLVFDTWSSYIDSPSAVGGQYDYSKWNGAVSASRIPIYQRTFTNANTTTTTVTIHVRAIQVTLRVWDVKTELTRQITIVQDL